MKKIIRLFGIIAVAMMTTFFFSACGNDSKESKLDSEKIKAKQQADSIEVQKMTDAGTVKTKETEVSPGTENNEQKTTVPVEKEEYGGEGNDIKYLSDSDIKELNQAIRKKNEEKYVGEGNTEVKNSSKSTQKTFPKSGIYISEQSSTLPNESEVSMFLSSGTYTFIKDQPAYSTAIYYVPGKTVIEWSSDCKDGNGELAFVVSDTRIVPISKFRGEGNEFLVVAESGTYGTEFNQKNRYNMTVKWYQKK
jgi:hypothetical protein